MATPEAVKANPFSGSASYAYRFEVPPGTGGLTNRVWLLLPGVPPNEYTWQEIKPRNTAPVPRQGHTAVYDSKDDWEVPVRAAQRQLSQFENLFKNLGDVANGFAKRIPLEDLANREEYDPRTLSENLMFGTPEEVVAKLRKYEELGVDEFTYYASMGLGFKEQKRSLELFCSEVIPAFA